MHKLAPIVAAVAVGIGTFTLTNVADTPKDLKGSIQIDGSSTVEPISSAVVEEFSKVAPKVHATVATSGTGGGFKRFVKGDLDISDASRPIKPDEANAASSAAVEFIELPIAFDGLSIVVNKKNTFVEKLTIDQLRSIFLESKAAKTWKDVNPAWPDTPIKIYAPGTDSGTFDYFKEVIVPKPAAAAPGAEAPKPDSIRGDMSVSEDDNVLVRGVSGDENAIGFFGFAYYWENKDKLKVVKIDGGKGPVEPNHDTIQSGTYAPFSRPLFIYVSLKAAARPEVESFVGFYLDHAAEMAEEVGYVKLPQSIYDIAKKNFKAKKTGSQYLGPDGKQRHGVLTEIYK